MPTGTLPKEAALLYEKVYKDYLHGECKGDEACAAKRAWGAVKQAGWRQGEDGKWQKRSDVIAEFSFAITKASFDKASGEMRWSAVASDTDIDSYGERMSIELFRDFIKRAESKEKPPEPFCTAGWCGGMPYPSIAHYSDLDGKAVPGKITNLYVDGNRLKAQGTFFDTELGRACFRSICDDLYGEKSEGQDKVRISIGFLDWAHKHSVALFERKSLSDQCPLCATGVGDKQYVRGHLLHLALTRVPVNKRTDIEPVMKSEEGEMATRKSDAASIIGEKLAEEIDEEAALVGKSEALVERAKDKEKMEDCEEDDEECKKKRKQMMKDKSESEECKSCGEEAPEAVEEGSEPEVAVVEVEAKSEGEAVYLSLGGARSFDEAEAYEASQQEAGKMYESLFMLEAIVGNIMASTPDTAERKSLLAEAMKGCRKRMEMKAMTALEQMSLVQKSDTVSTPEHVLDGAVAELKSSFDQVVALEAAAEEKLHALDTPLTNLVELIRTKIVAPKAVEPVVEPPAAPDELGLLRSELQTLAESVKQLTIQLSAKSTAAPAAVQGKPPLPERRSIVPSLVQRAEAERAPENPNSFRAVARRNTGLPTY